MYLQCHIYLFQTNFLCINRQNLFNLAFNFLYSSLSYISAFILIFYIISESSENEMIKMKNI